VIRRILKSRKAAETEEWQEKNLSRSISKEEESVYILNSDAHFLQRYLPRDCGASFFFTTTRRILKTTEVCQGCLDDLPFEMVEHLINISVPSYARILGTRH
jgi:hypothetical protein